MTIAPQTIPLSEMSGPKSGFLDSLQSTLSGAAQSWNMGWVALILICVFGAAFAFWVLEQRKEAEEADEAADTEVPSFTEIERKAMQAGEPVDYVANPKPDPRLVHPEKLREP